MESNEHKRMWTIKMKGNYGFICLATRNATGRFRLINNFHAPRKANNPLAFYLRRTQNNRRQQPFQFLFAGRSTKPTLLAFFRDDDELPSLKNEWPVRTQLVVQRETYTGGECACFARQPHNLSLWTPGGHFLRPKFSLQIMSGRPWEREKLSYKYSHSRRSACKK